MSLFGQGAPKRPEPVTFTYVEYLEFRYDEFKKFSQFPPITDYEIKSVDLDRLVERLQETP